jgi:hypothetical protein
MIEIHCLDGELLVSNESHTSSIIISSLDMGGILCEEVCLFFFRSIII